MHCWVLPLSTGRARCLGCSGTDQSGSTGNKKSGSCVLRRRRRPPSRSRIAAAHASSAASSPCADLSLNRPLKVTAKGWPVFVVFVAQQMPRTAWGDRLRLDSLEVSKPGFVRSYLHGARLCYLEGKTHKILNPKT